MGIGAWLGGKLLGGVVGKVAGNVAKGATQVLTTSAGAVGKAFEDSGDVKSARVFASPSEHSNGILRRVADAINMMIRPMLAVFVMYMVYAYMMWGVQWDLAGIDEDVKTWFEWVMTFYFGQRAVVHDMPRMIRNFRKAFAK